MFSLFRRRRHPSHEWREDRKVQLIVDLDRFELSGVGLGEDIARLSFLGRSESRFFDYPSKGLQLDVDDGSLAGFSLALRRDVYLGTQVGGRVQRFAGRIRMKGRDWEPHELRGERDFVEVWGAPYWRDEDEDEILLFFEFPNREITVELSLQGVPQVLIVSRQPLMADAEQRERYGVTASWPPYFEGD